MIIDNETLKFLPYSGRRYVISQDGHVFNADGSSIETKMTEEGLVVELAWLDGVKDYLVGMLVIVTYQPMYLPEHLWIEIEPLYYDENPCNNHVKNLTYRFRCGLLPYEERSGFFYIPTYTAYAINRHGAMVSTENNRFKTWYRVKNDLIRNSKGGYFATRVRNVPGVSGTLLRHRALCMVFKPIESAHTYDMIVNHEDGIPGNDDLDNINWSTYSVNNKHAHESGLTGGRKTAILVKDLRSGEIKKYKTLTAASKALGHINTAPIRFRIRHRPDTLYDDYLQFKFDDGSEWLPVDMQVEPIKFIIGSKLAARNVFTGEVITFSSFDEGSALTGVDKQTIMIHVRDGQIMPFKGYNFSYYTEGKEWPEHGKWHLEAYKAYPVRTPDPIIVTDLETGVEKFFPSRNELAEHFGISPSYATQITLKGWALKHRYLPRYYNLRENIKVPLDWKVQL